MIYRFSVIKSSIRGWTNHEYKIHYGLQKTLCGLQAITIEKGNIFTIRYDLTDEHKYVTCGTCKRILKSKYLNEKV